MHEPSTSQTQAITSETLLALFRRAAHFMARAYHHQGHAQHAQRRVLAILKENGPMNQRVLLDLLGVRSASLSELLSKLERGGLIAREKDEQDKRNYIISISDGGNAAMDGHESEQRDGAEAIFAPLATAERQQLGELLIKVIVALEDNFPAHHGCRGQRACEMRDQCGHEHGHGPRNGHHCREGHGHCHEKHAMAGRNRQGAHGRGPGSKKASFGEEPEE